MRSVCVCVPLSILCFTLPRTVTAQGKSQSDSYVLPNIGSLTPIFLFGDSISGSSTNFYFVNENLTNAPAIFANPQQSNPKKEKKWTFHCKNERTKSNFRYPCIDGFFFSSVWLYSFSLFLLLWDKGRVVQVKHFTLINKFYVTNIIYPLMKAAKSFLHLYKASIHNVYAEWKVKASWPKLNLLTCLNQNSSQRKTSKR